MLTTNQDEQLNQLLGISIADFDIPDAVYELAVSRYEQLGSWLAEYWAESPSDGAVYAQGSFSLGTVVQPINPRDHYDIDLVCRRDLAKESITQSGLKTDVGYGLRSYVQSGPRGLPTMSEGKRCWTLDYPAEGFHMDALPAIPNRDGSASAILLTDKELREWQHSNPIDFASWFRRQMHQEFLQLREVMRKSMDVADVPAWKVKTTLQQTVQALKRHRDIHFERTPNDRPASIIITTLAGLAYEGGASLFEVLVDLTRKMPGLVERRNGVYWIPNPVLPAENFADRWRTNPGRDQTFFRWIEQAHADFAGYGADRGVDQVLTKMARIFGEGPAKRAGELLGSSLRTTRDAGLLGSAAGTGMLTSTVRRPVPQHTFHGGRDDRPSGDGS